jgi:putative transposase
VSYTNLLYHITFSTKERRTLLKPALLPRVTQYIGGIVRELDGQLLAANGDADHLHLAALASPTTAVANLVRTVKANSSKWIHESLPNMEAFGWQEGYAAFTVSQSVLPRVMAYIQGQPEHHKKADFKQEFIALLKKHGIPFDERFLWG